MTKTYASLLSYILLLTIFTKSTKENENVTLYDNGLISKDIYADQGFVEIETQSDNASTTSMAGI